MGDSGQPLYKTMDTFDVYILINSKQTIYTQNVTYVASHFEEQIQTIFLVCSLFCPTRGQDNVEFLQHYNQTDLFSQHACI